VRKPNAPTGVDAERPPRSQPPRWGVRTICLVGVAFLCMVTANALHDMGVDYWGLLPLAGTVAALAGAAYCSFRGLRSFTWLQR
jgi:hypothetical protein